MPKITDRAAYIREQAKKAGFDEAATEQVLKAFENKSFTDGFTLTPDYSHDLDEVRARAKTEVETGYKEWHDGEVKKFENNDKIWREQQALVAKYKELYGDIDTPTPNHNPNRNGGAKGMTPEEIKKMFDEQEKRTQDMLMRRDSATLDLMAIREDYMDRFKKRLNVGEFEKAWKEHPEW